MQVTFVDNPADCTPFKDADNARKVMKHLHKFELENYGSIQSQYLFESHDEDFSRPIRLHIRRINPNTFESHFLKIEG